MAAAARETGLVLMEAYMSAFHPRRQRVIDLARSGALGELRAMSSCFTFPNDDATNYRWLRAMGGGALLDVGVYCIEPLGGGLLEQRLSLVERQPFAFYRNLADHLLFDDEPLAVDQQSTRRLISILEAAHKSAERGGRPITPA